MAVFPMEVLLTFRATEHHEYVSVQLQNQWSRISQEDLVPDMPEGMIQACIRKFIHLADAFQFEGVISNYQNNIFIGNQSNVMDAFDA